MEKRKIQIEEVKPEYTNISEVCLVKKRIPYEEKIALAEELLQLAYVIDDENGIGYLLEDYEAKELFLILKYYSDIDTSEFESKDLMWKLYDYLTGTDHCADKIFEAIGEDYGIVLSIFSRFKKAVESAFKEKQSIGGFLQKAIMPLLSESGIVDTLAKAESTTDTMKKMYDAYRRAEDEEKMKKSGKVNVGGAILNFAKK